VIVGHDDSDGLYTEGSLEYVSLLGEFSFGHGTRI